LSRAFFVAEKAYVPLSRHCRFILHSRGYSIAIAGVYNTGRVLFLPVIGDILTFVSVNIQYS